MHIHGCLIYVIYTYIYKQLRIFEILKRVVLQQDDHNLF